MKESIFVTPEWRRTLKAKFLNTAFRNCPGAWNLLAQEMHAGRITPHQWAERFNVAGTWIERWAVEVLGVWLLYPKIYPNYPLPCDEKQEGDAFSFAITDVRPFSSFSLGVISGGSLPDNAEPDDWKGFENEMHRRLDQALKRYRETPAQCGASLEVEIPNDLDLKLGVAALYLFRGMSLEEIGNLQEVARERTAVDRWLNEILPLLHLRMRGPGVKPSFRYSLQ